MVVANNTVRNDQGGDTSWTWQNGFAETGSYNPTGDPYLTYSDAEVVADGTAETATVTILNNGVGALAVMVLNHATTVAECGDGSVDVGEQCDDGNVTNGDCCSSTCQFESAATVCRTSIGVCDVAETCDGAGTCAPNGFASAATICRASAGVCDVAETCSGSSVACPADGFEPVSTTCRVSAGACDIAESCSGSSVACPADGFEPASTSCRSAAGNCDQEEFCTGTGGSCPTDIVLDGVPCLDSNVCNGAEQCVVGVCQAATPLSCEDANVCTADSCDPISGCSYTVIPECMTAVPIMPWTGRAILVFFLVLSAGFALALGPARKH
ncbi:MAG: hypothetical protein GY910_20975, partial [bacterium]|nr:hypothetical protein [bacterium]